MAIQIPDAGTGNGATGDNEFVLWTKVINNFSDQTNAANKLVGTGAEQIPQNKHLGTAATKDVGTSTGQVPLAQDTFKAAYGIIRDAPSNGTVSIDDLESGTVTLLLGGLGMPSGLASAVVETKSNYSSIYATSLKRQTVYSLTNNSVWGRAKQSSGAPAAWRPFFEYLTTANTTKDANGFLKGASPIVKVFADKVELNDDAVNQNVTYKKNGIGDYAITTVSGLSTDGWYIELPKDMNGNPKVAVTLEETDGVISLKSYKRIFSMETFTFEPDLDNPLDIPDARWIDLRLNEIPFEAQEELPTDGG